MDKMFGTEKIPEELVKISEQVNLVRVLNVDYVHIKFKNGDDIYLTENGFKNYKNLLPENFWTDENWFRMNSTRLQGSSLLYKIRSKYVDGKSLDIVLKWNRMGQDVPRDVEIDEIMSTEFNSPYEEISLVQELINSSYESSGRIITQVPLAIFVPSKKLELWQTGRIENMMQEKISEHTEIELDMHRQYAVIYEWVPGIDATEAYLLGILTQKDIEALTLKVENEMKKKGFRVRDRKPHHIIVQLETNRTLVKKFNGEINYAVVDYELLERTPEREEYIKNLKRKEYLTKQAERFNINKNIDYPPNLHPVNILDVDYVYGHVESTNGRLWVVGKDYTLFDYFLPEKWENSPRTKLSSTGETYYVLTKDKINLVWKLCNIGYQPDVDPYNKNNKRIIMYGYNSPFEEISFTFKLNKSGIPTIYPRAIYMTGNKIKTSSTDLIPDLSRYKTHENLMTPDGIPILLTKHDYITLWGYWNGPDEKLANKDGDYYKSINALFALRKGIITENEYISLIDKITYNLSLQGIEDLNLNGRHLLLSIDNNGILVKDKFGIPEIRICNFEFIRNIPDLIR